MSDPLARALPDCRSRGAGLRPALGNASKCEIRKSTSCIVSFDLAFRRIARPEGPAAAPACICVIRVICGPCLYARARSSSPERLAGIGHAIAMRAAADGANVVIAAKTTEPHPKLPGTIHTAAADVEAAGGTGARGRHRHPRRGAGRGGDRRRRRALRRHRHPRQQRLGDQPHRHARHADEALRPDASDQHARHVPLHAEGGAAPREIRESARPQHLAAAAFDAEPALVRPARRLHDGEVRHVALRARHGGGVSRRSASPSTRCGRARRSIPRRSG